MNISSLSDLSRQHMLNILGFSGSNPGTKENATSAATAGSGSPFAQMLADLQSLQQSNPAQFAQISQQISTNLSTAASNAQAQGLSSLASQLTMLSKDFSGGVTKV